MAEAKFYRTPGINPNASGGAMFDPTQEAKIKQQRELAARLEKIGASTPTEMVSGGKYQFAVPKSMLESASKGIAQGLGAYETAQANSAEQEMEQTRQKLYSEALQRMGEGDSQAAYETLANDPRMIAQALDMKRQDMLNESKLQREDYNFDREADLKRELARMNQKVVPQWQSTNDPMFGKGQINTSTGEFKPVKTDIADPEKANAQKEAALGVVNRLLDNVSGVRANRGGISTLFPNISNDAVNAEADLATLQSLLTVENLGLLKGVLSDTDMKILKDIGAGGLNGADKQVLGNLRQIQQKLQGEQPQQQPNGVKFLGFE